MRSRELAAHAEMGIFSQQQHRKDQRVCLLLNYLAETFPAIPTPLPSFPLLQPTPSCQTASGKGPPIRNLANSIQHSRSEALLLAEFPRTGRLTSELTMTGSWMLILKVFPHFYTLATEEWYIFPNFPKLYSVKEMNLYYWKCFINSKQA